MRRDFFQPHVKYTPFFNLESLITHEELVRLRRCKMKTRNDLLRERSNKALLDLTSTEYLSRYIDWLDSLKQSFCQAYDLCRSFPKQDLSALRHFCKSLNDQFKKHYQISTHVKMFLEKQAEYLKTYYHFDQVEAELLYTPSRLPAVLILEINKYLAKQGDALARKYLIEQFYLSEKFTDREIEKYEPLSFERFHQLMKQCYNPSVKKRYFFLERKCLQNLDEILCLDNIDELILWRIGNHRLVLIALYQRIQKRIIKEDSSYTISDNEIDVDEMISRMDRLCG